MALTELEEDLLQYLTDHHVAAFESALERAQANLDLEAVGGDPLHPIPRLDIHLALDPSTAADYSPLLGHLLTHYAGTPYFNPHMPSTLGRQCYRYLLRACFRTLSDYSLGPQLPYYYHHHHHPLGNPTDSAHTIRTILFHHVRSLFHRFTAHSLHSAFPNSDRGLKTGMLASTPNSESPPPLPLAGETLLASLVSIVPVPPSGEPVLPTDHEEEEEEGGTTPTKTGACLHVGILTSFHSYGAVVHTLRTLAHQLSRWGSWVVVSGQSTGRVPQRKYFESSNGAEYLEDPCLGDASDGVLLVDEASALPPAQLIMLDRLLQHNLAAVQSFPEVATPDYSQRVAELAHYLAHCRQVAVHTVDGRVLSAPLSTSSSPTCPGHPSPSPVDSRLLLSRYFDRFRAWQRKHPYVLESGSRVLITLTKLTQAHAKLHLRTVPQVEDALFSVRVMEATLTVKYRACVCSQGGLDWLISD
ncbi:hypothetical protein BJ085DRAFT_31904 [Dimargaris cristalligena]|uniref:Uncharacterized protein n=1 Tax=Dimargaris cristalligena TaxID=215637 RepID=A0A4P9ZSL7_9FUNG|nr:hypothetical protein BJ085DRAFT_31904 [Dimargaris cristalligena]|eukprot:RKP36566.1 hypothetical protein BJ085DRAFT_31904 [Dimargaris cristalligena]